MNCVCIMNNSLYTDVMLTCVYKTKNTLGFNVVSLSCFLLTPHCVQDMSFASRWDEILYISTSHSIQVSPLPVISILLNGTTILPTSGHPTHLSSPYKYSLNYNYSLPCLLIYPFKSLFNLTSFSSLTSSPLHSSWTAWPKGFKVPPGSCSIWKEGQRFSSFWYVLLS